MPLSQADPSPDSAQAHEQRGFALFREGRYADAAQELAAVVQLQPQSAAAHSNLGAALGQMGKIAESLACYEQALALDEGHATSHLNVASLLAKIGRPLEAVQRFRIAHARFPHDPGVQYAAGTFYRAQGLQEEAFAAFARALEADPDFAPARWVQAIMVIPQAYGPGEDPASFRLEFEAALRALAQWFDAGRLDLGPRGVGAAQPFYLAFMEESNKALLSEYGDLCARLMATVPITRPAAPRLRSGAMRVAVVSGHIHDQSVWTALLRGWCTNIDRDKVELHLFHTGTTIDAETGIARAHASSFHVGLGDVVAWANAIQAVEPDVILYPEIGMDATSARLAALRLASVQVASWGHPETSGLPTIDYYISAAAFEPSGAEANYRERLVALPGVGCYYDDLVPEFVGTDWASMGVDPYAPRLMCAGTPYKYMPQHDHLLVKIAKRVPDVQLLFFVDKAPLLSEQIERRLAIAFGNAGLEATRHVKFLPRQLRPAFFGMMRDCDAMLDTIGFSGFNTTMQAIECDLPVVAWEGRFMRGRLASGTLRTMGMDELVATTPEQYVDLAARLCRDATYRLKISARISERKSVLFRDLRPVRALERFLLEAAATGP